ncbi:hypothetical protein [Nocardia sp. NPDC056564]|uniref:hypothetical protein n=1 Tax=Nocardia sp. NPDC056564 TaxID=3345865 RepID=UPI00366B2BA7
MNLRRLDTRPGLRAEGDQVVDLDDHLAVLTALRDEGKIGATGLGSAALDGGRRSPTPRHDAFADHRITSRDRARTRSHTVPRPPINRG